MGGYAGFVWPAYGLAAIVLGGLALGSTGALHVDALGLGLDDGRTRSVRFIALGLAGRVDRLLALLAGLLEGLARR